MIHDDAAYWFNESGDRVNDRFNDHIRRCG